MAHTVLAAATGLAAFLAAYAGGVAGVSTSLVALPLLILVFGGLSVAVPLYALLELIYAAKAYWSQRREASLKKQAFSDWIVYAGILCGATVFIFAEHRILEKVFVVFAFMFAVKLFYGARMKLPSLPSAMNRFLGGLLGGVYADGKPLLVHELGKRGEPYPKQSALFLYKAVFQVVAFTAAGYLSPAIIAYAAVGAAALLLGELLAKYTPHGFGNHETTTALSLFLGISSTLILLT